MATLRSTFGSVLGSITSTANVVGTTAEFSDRWITASTNAVLDNQTMAIRAAKLSRATNLAQEAVESDERHTLWLSNNPERAEEFKRIQTYIESGELV